MPEVVPFKPLTQPTDIAEGLRQIADRLDRDEFEVVMQTCIVVLGATTLEGPIDSPESHHIWHNRFDFGPRQDGLTVAGLLYWALSKLGR